MQNYSIDGNRAYDLLKRLGPSRLGGSQNEENAAQVLKEEIKTLNREAVEQVFQVETSTDMKSSLQILEPFNAEIPCEAIALSGQTPPEGIEAEMIFAESGGAKYLAGSKGKIALLYGRLNANKYESLLLEDVAGFVCIGKPNIKNVYNMLEIHWIERWGKRPGAFINFEDGLRLVKNGAKKVRLQVRQKEYTGKSRNVVVEIPGRRHPEEIIVIGAHYDSHRGMDGAHDNGAGSVVAMELCRYFSENPADRTLRFVWFGCEELGCRGSAAFIDQNEDDLNKIIFMLNLDLGGGIIGQDAVDIMGPPELVTFFELINKERGLDWLITEKVYGGDNGPFVGKGIPAATIYRADGTCYFIHSKDDSLELVDGYHLGLLAEQAAEFLDRAANAYRFPFERKISEKIRQQYKNRMLMEYHGLTEVEAEELLK